MNRALKNLRSSFIIWCLIVQNAAYGQSPDSVAYYRTVLAAQNKIGISAHRGSSEIAPENTLATFRAVLQMQVDYIEIDVRTTKDGQLVILHDGTLNRTTTGAGPVKDQALAELKKLSAAKGYDNQFQKEQIPTLDEVGELLADWNAHHPSKTNLYVDCKDVAPEPLVEILTKYGLLNDAVFYGSDEKLLALQKVAPTAKLMPGLKNADAMADKISKLHPYAFDVSWPALSESLVGQIHHQKIKVFSDLLDFYDLPSQYAKAAQFGIDVIQTDHVLKVYRTLATKMVK
ncbi:glycerophosphodiester phosphodiesterase family protein [Spirosoma aureum]|uniref:Glycerophosphodiester phosphodiesterase family protein n=1 Tax=Spirosoma aureum TaxID=2692134 RepID=A0A6G9AXS3_9BACT|nr:glycerophosphodiester phosphodiesterase family protein [Spirosoma aureum]QIP17085.1 glycerophosphodiester phosphodiesterase family protein [Spirosoma aureum]